MVAYLFVRIMEGLKALKLRQIDEKNFENNESFRSFSLIQNPPNPGR
jgi:hypothetical protein